VKERREIIVSVIIAIVMITISWIIVDRLWCIDLCKTWYCGIPTKEQIRECYMKCGVPYIDIEIPVIAEFVIAFFMVGFLTVLLILFILGLKYVEDKDRDNTPEL